MGKAGLIGQKIAATFSSTGTPSHFLHPAEALLVQAQQLARSLAERPIDVPPPDARLETQFLTPVQLPARVNIKQWVEDGQSKRAMCDVRTGRVHMLAHWSR